MRDPGKEPKSRARGSLRQQLGREATPGRGPAGQCPFQLGVLSCGAGRVAFAGQLVSSVLAGFPDRRGGVSSKQHAAGQAGHPAPTALPPGGLGIVFQRIPYPDVTALSRCAHFLAKQITLKGGRPSAAGVLFPVGSPRLFWVVSPGRGGQVACVTVQLALRGREAQVPSTRAFSRQPSSSPVRSGPAPRPSQLPGASGHPPLPRTGPSLRIPRGSASGSRS